MMRVATIKTGRLPIQLDNGTHQMLPAPRKSTWTWICEQLVDFKSRKTYCNEVGQLRNRAGILREGISPNLEAWCNDRAGEVGYKGVDGDHNQSSQFVPLREVGGVSRIGRWRRKFDDFVVICACVDTRLVPRPGR